jgi:hypothetical protein
MGRPVCTGRGGDTACSVSVCGVAVPIAGERLVERCVRRVRAAGVGGVVAKKVLTWTAILFAIFYILSAPDDAANAVRSAGDGLRAAGDSVAEFFNALFD